MHSLACADQIILSGRFCLFFYLLINVFHREAIRPEGSNHFSSGVHTSIPTSITGKLKPLVIFQGREYGLSVHPSGSAYASTEPSLLVYAISAKIP